MTAFSDALKQWWDTAEQGDAVPGDQIIERHVNEETGEVIRYVIGEHRKGMRGLIGKSGTRILSRAPQPKWYDAVAVVARCADDDSVPREVFLRSEATNDVWVGEGGWANTHNLRDVTPLVPAEPTKDLAELLVREFSGDITYDEAWGILETIFEGLL